MNNFAEEYQKRTDETNAVIARYLPEDDGDLWQHTLIAAMNESVLAGGKRLRPLFMREVYRLFGGTNEVVEPFMAAIEMIHTFSLVHDDLPCMDNDRLRRGKPTTWSVYGEDMATVAGDALCLYAFETAGRAFEMTDDPAKVGRAMTILATESGVTGMCGGQSIDVEKTGCQMDEEELANLYDLKTGALLRASMCIGAVLAGAGEKETALIKELAGNVGMAFQIRDDILDVSGTEQTLGKSVGSDKKNQKTTFVSLFGIEKAEEKAKVYEDRAAEILQQLERKGYRNEFLKDLIASLTDRRK